MRQAIIWTNVGKLYLRIYASLALHEFNSYHDAFYLSN